MLVAAPSPNTGRNWRISLVVTAFATLSVPYSISASDNSDPALSRIVTSWRTREEKWRSYSLSWREERLDKAQAFFEIRTRARWPEKDTTYASDCRLSVDRDRSKYNFDGKGWREDTDGQPAISDRNYCAVFDGTDAKTFRESNRRDTYRGYGMIEGRKSNPEMELITINGVQWFFRPLTPSQAGLDEASLTVLAERASVDGVDCIRVTATQQHLRRTWRLWIEDGPDCLIRRAELVPILAHDPVVILEMDYAARGDLGALPSTWVLTWSRRGRVEFEITATIVDCKRDISFADKHFELEFPAGTRVHDKRGDHPTDFLVKPNGKIRRIAEHELTRPFKELMTTTGPDDP